MGQQQLLLLVLGIVIVGIAVVGGITAFSEGRQKSERDAAAVEALRIVSGVQAWKLRPVALGGGDNGTASFASVSLHAIGIAPNNGRRYRTASACFRLSAGTSATLRVYTPDCATRIATITIRGTTPDQLTWAYN